VYFDESKANRTLDFIKELKHTKGRFKGVPFTVLPWQEQAITDIFGTVRESGHRQYTTAYLEVTKKQGKSELGAAIALYLLCADGEHFAEVYGCAADRQNASIIYDVAVDMVDQDPELRKVIKPVISQKRLIYTATKSYYQVLSAEAYSKHGYNVHGVIFDELHAQPNRKLYDVMTEGSGDAREQPLYFLITTAGDDADRKTIGWEVHKTAVDILTGVKEDPTFYAMIYGLDKEEKRIWTGRKFEKINKDLSNEQNWRDVWGNEKVWEKVNPSIGHTVAWEKVCDHYLKVKGNPVQEKNFRWLRLNSWEKVKTEKWMGLDFWDRCKGKVDMKRLEGRPCYGGLDLSSKIDLTSYVLLFPPDDINKKWIVLPWFWLPEDAVAERVQSDNVPYDQWTQQGYIETTPGNAIDYAHIEKKILGLKDIYDVKELGYDPWNALQTAMRLEDEGLVVAEIRQGYKSLSAPMKEIEQLVRSQKLQHGGHPVLRWNVGNVETKSDENDNIRPIKSKSTERIDGVVAMINGMARAMLEEDHESIYSERDVLTI